MKKTELLLAKPSLIESLIGELLSRPTKLAQHTPQQAQAGAEHTAGDMWKEMMAQWEALTAMKIQDGVAIIPLRGMVTPDDPFSPFFGETNLAMFTKNFDQALEDSKVKAIVLNIYSPGGYVYGVEAAANRIFEARGKKPIVAYTDTLAASAAYWIATAADKIVLGSETAEVGSIGVYLVHFDYSEMLTEAGIKVTEITSGEFKGIGSPYSAMTAEEKKMLQADSNYVFTRFVNTVARNRGASVQDVLKSANGLTFYGSEAIKAGLADSINTFQEVLAMATTPANSNTATQPTAEQQAAADKEAAEKLAAKTESERMAAELKSYKDKEAKEASDKAAAECTVAVKAAFGRDATPEEIKSYQGMNEEGRKTYKATLAESARNRDTLVKKAGLTEEQVKDNGSLEENSPDNNLIVLAARSLGLAVTK